jgi:hypothetical protein
MQFNYVSLSFGKADAEERRANMMRFDDMKSSLFSYDLKFVMSFDATFVITWSKSQLY